MDLDKLLSTKVGGFSLGSLLSALVILLIGAIAVKIMMKFVERALKKGSLEAGLKNFIRSCSHVLLWIIVGLIIADTLGIPSATLVASLSVAGLALSLSLQNILSNVFSGFTILFTRPFVSGDYIEVGAASGTVSAIGLFYTTVSTPDKKEIHIPNGEVAATKIVNCTHCETRRVDLSFGLGYECAPGDVRTALLAAAGADGRVMPDPAPAVLLSAYGASNIEYTLRAWVKSEDYWDVYFDLNEAAAEYLREAGLGMAYDHVDVKIVKD